jgi:hypothetical protein
MIVTTTISPDAMAETCVTITQDTARIWQEGLGVDSLTELDDQRQRELYADIRARGDRSGLPRLTELHTADGSLIIDPEELGPELAERLLPERPEGERLDPTYAPVHFILKVLSPRASRKYAKLSRRIAQGRVT